MHVVDGGWFVYVGGYNIDPASPRAHQSRVFVKQQTLQKRDGGTEREEVSGKTTESSLESIYGHKKLEKIKNKSNYYSRQVEKHNIYCSVQFNFI